MGVTTLPTELKTYLGTVESQELSPEVQAHPNVTVVTERHVVKVRTREDLYFLSLLRRERDFLAAGLTLPTELPEVAFEDFDEQRGVLVTCRLPGSPLGDRRRWASVPVSYQGMVLDRIHQLQRVPPPPDWTPTYDRNKKLARYTDIIGEAGRPELTDLSRELNQLSG